MGGELAWLAEWPELLAFVGDLEPDDEPWPRVLGPWGVGLECPRCRYVAAGPAGREVQVEHLRTHLVPLLPLLPHELPSELLADDGRPLFRLSWSETSDAERLKHCSTPRECIKCGTESFLVGGWDACRWCVELARLVASRF